VKIYVLELLLILSKDILNALDLGVLNIAVEREAVIDAAQAHVVGDTAEAIDGEGLIVVVTLKKAADISNGMLVLVVAA
jgi:hypothetical protein